MEGICRVLALWAVGPHQSPTASTCFCHRKLGILATTPLHVGLHHTFLLCARHHVRNESGEKSIRAPPWSIGYRGQQVPQKMCQPVCLSFLARLTDKHIGRSWLNSRRRAEDPLRSDSGRRPTDKGDQVFDSEISALEGAG